MLTFWGNNIPVRRTSKERAASSGLPKVMVEAHYRTNMECKLHHSVLVPSVSLHNILSPATHCLLIRSIMTYYAIQFCGNGKMPMIISLQILFEKVFITTPKCCLWAILLVPVTIQVTERHRKEVCLYERIPTMESDLWQSDVSGSFSAWSSINRADFQPPSTMCDVWGHPPPPLPPTPRPRSWPSPSGITTPASPAEMGSVVSKPECKAQSRKNPFVFGGTATAKENIHIHSYLNKVHIQDFTWFKCSVRSPRREK